MRLLADENQHPKLVARLRAAGYQVEYVRETSAGSDDSEILLRADIGSFVFLTDDRDFGDLIFSQGYPAPLAILYMRLDRVTPDLVADRLLALLATGVAQRHIITITKDSERLKPFPPGAQHD